MCVSVTCLNSGTCSSPARPWPASREKYFHLASDSSPETRLPDHYCQLHGLPLQQKLRKPTVSSFCDGPSLMASFYGKGRSRVLPSIPQRAICPSRTPLVCQGHCLRMGGVCGHRRRTNDCKLPASATLRARSQVRTVLDSSGKKAECGDATPQLCS